MPRSKKETSAKKVTKIKRKDDLTGIEDNLTESITTRTHTSEELISLEPELPKPIRETVAEPVPAPILASAPVMVLDFDSFLNILETHMSNKIGFYSKNIGALSATPRPWTTSQLVHQLGLNNDAHVQKISEWDNQITDFYRQKANSKVAPTRPVSAIQLTQVFFD